jgi:hypothetical protein
MNTIVDMYGRPIASGYGKLLEATKPGPNVPLQTTVWEDIDKSVKGYEWRNLVSAGRKLYTNFGPFRAAADDKAAYSIGQSFIPSFFGDDKEWGAQATAWLIDEWFPLAEIRNDWWTTLFLASTNVDHSGDCGVLYTERGGMPSLQLIPAHRIGARWNQEGIVPKGRFKNFRHDRGVVFGPYGEVIGYLLLGDTEREDIQVSVDEMTLLMDPMFINQSRGFPIFVHAIREGRTAMKAQEYEEFAALIAGSIGLIEHNETGSAEDEGLDINTIGGSVSEQEPEGLKIENLSGGMIRYFKAGTGSKLEQFSNSRPTDFWDRFQDRLLRVAAAGTGWPYELLWKFEGLSGPAVRAVQNKARRCIADRQSLLKPVAKRAVLYALSKAMENGLLPFSADWMKFSLTMPPLLSIDEGRDANARREDYKLGYVTMSEILTAEGRGDYRQHVRNLAVEAAIREQEREAVEAEYGVEIDRREIQMRTPNETAVAPSPAPAPDDDMNETPIDDNGGENNDGE